MSAPNNPADPPMSEPGKRASGSDVGGVAAAPQTGVADWAQRSAERGEAPAIGRASTGDAAAATGPRIDRGGKDAPGSAPGASARPDRPASDDRATPLAGSRRGSATGAAPAEGRRNADEDEDEWRHEPIAPVDEPNPLRSLGKAVGETLTGSDQDTPGTSKR